MLCEKIELHCGHKLRMKTFESASKDGLCPRHECRCHVSEDEMNLLREQVILWKTPMWELMVHGRPATEEEKRVREESMRARPPLMGQCQGRTKTGEHCRCTATKASGGRFCRLHVM